MDETQPTAKTIPQSKAAREREQKSNKEDLGRMETSDGRRHSLRIRQLEEELGAISIDHKKRRTLKYKIANVGQELEEE